MESARLTIYFEDPFWVGLVELEDGGTYRVSRHVFGPEPTMPEVEQFTLANWNRLHFSPAQKAIAKPPKHTNPKRAQRDAIKEMAKAKGASTKAQQALAEQREASSDARKQQSHQRREEQKRQKYELAKEKRKQKHRGK